MLDEWTFLEAYEGNEVKYWFENERKPFMLGCSCTKKIEKLVKWKVRTLRS